MNSSLVEKPVLWTISKLGASVQSGKGWTTQTAASVLTYQYFERLVWRRFGAAIRARTFDVVHRLTPLSPTIPTPIAARCQRAGVAVLGPLNGGIAMAERVQGLAHERTRVAQLRARRRLVPGYKSTRRDASAIIVASRATAQQLPPPISIRQSTYRRMQSIPCALGFKQPTKLRYR